MLKFVDWGLSIYSFVFEGTITNAVVIACFNWFAEQIEKLTTIVIDNASIHARNEFKSNLEDWEERGLKICRLSATYSPEFNIIEMVWRKIKYY